MIDHCVYNCGDNFYTVDTPNRVCTACHSTCMKCTGSLETECTKCDSTKSLFFQDNKCVLDCGDFFFGDVSKSKCEACHDTCNTCESSLPDACIVCKVYRKDTLCVDDCGSNYYLDNNVCKICNSKCATCSGPSETNCLSCDGTYLKGTECLT